MDPRIVAKQTGITLLEALIALLVLSVGLLGLAGLQAQGLSYNHDAQVRTQATLLAYDLTDRMRMRLWQVSSSDDAATLAAALADMNAFMAAPAAACTTAAKMNSTAVADEVDCWHQKVGDNLPGAQATVQRINDNGTAADPSDDQYQIQIQWLDRSAGNNRSQTWTVQL